jgi:hypothetical protein
VRRVQENTQQCRGFQKILYTSTAESQEKNTPAQHYGGFQNLHISALQQVKYRGTGTCFGDGGHEQLISNGEKFKSAFAKRVKQQTRIDHREISTNWLKTSYFPP